MIKPYVNRGQVKLGSCALTFTPPVGYQWQVMSIAISNNATTVVPTVFVYLDSIFICGSSAGLQDTADGSPIPVKSGSQLTILWAAAANQSVCIAQLIVQETPI